MVDQVEVKVLVIFKQTFGPEQDAVPENPSNVVPEFESKFSFWGTDWTRLNCYTIDQVLYRKGPRANGRYCCSCDHGSCCFCGQ